MSLRGFEPRSCRRRRQCCRRRRRRRRWRRQNTSQQSKECSITFALKFSTVKCRFMSSFGDTKNAPSGNLPNANSPNGL